MRLSRNPRPRVYSFSAFVLILAGLLLFLGLTSVHRQRELINQMVRSRDALAAQTVAAELERFTIEFADRCLHAANVSGAAPPPGVCPVNSRLYLISNAALIHPRDSNAPIEHLISDLADFPPPVFGKVYPIAYTSPGKAQLFYMRMAGPPDDCLVLALLIDLKHTSEDVLRYAISFAPISARLTDSNNRTDDSKSVAHFSELFPFWQMEVSSDGDKQSTRELWLFTGLSISAAGSLGIAVIVCAAYVIQRAYVLKGRELFAMNAAHALRTPLSVICQQAGQLERPDTEVNRTRAAKVIVSASELLNRTIERLFSYSQIGENRRTYKLYDDDLARVTLSTVEESRGWLHQQGVDISLAVSEWLPPIRFDEAAIKEAILNLLENAVKYSGNSKRVCVRVFPSGNKAIIEVEDFGVGLRAEEHRRIFNAFYRATGSSDKEGLGLGLFIVRHIMEGHGGRVLVRSSLDQGSTFSLIFPINMEEWSAENPNRGK